ncbi:MAG: FtsX-like permease family protein [Terriglobia bacterium]|jgi:putative ABC transport system permease protein
MLVRILLESLARRRRRKLLSALAIALGIAAAATEGILSLDVGDKISRELRSYGANLSITPAADSLAISVGGVDYRPAGSGAFIPEDELVKLKKIFWRNNIVAFTPFLYVPAKVDDQNAILIGTWFEKSLRVDKFEVFATGLKKLHPSWKVEGEWPDDESGAGVLVGRRLAARLGVRVGGTISIKLGGDSTALSIQVRGILETGGAEDNQVLAPLALAQRLAGLGGKVRRVEVSALTKPEDAFARSDLSKLSPQELDRWYCTPYASSIAYQIQQAIPEAQVTTIYQVADTEGKILNRVGVLMGVLALAALLAAGLAVASMMLATALERRAEIGLFKSLGATDARVATLLLLEAGVLGLVGGIAGYLLGSVLAWRVALVVFGVPVGVHLVMLPVCLGLALAVTLAGSVFPLGRALKVSPAVVLRD